jgi:hypothetical protein
VKKCCTAGQAIDDNMAHAHGMLNNYGYRYTLGIYNAYCFSTPTMVRRTCLSVTLYVYSFFDVILTVHHSIDLFHLPT